MKAKDLKNSILQMAVEGKLVPQDPSDEPVSVLLERIREEKHKLIAEGKAKFPKGGESIIYTGSDGFPYEKRVDAKGRVLSDECIADEVPFDLPEGWAWARLGSISTISGGGTPDKGNTKYWGGELCWASMKDIHGDILSNTIDHITQEGLHSKASISVCHPGDLIVSTRLIPGKSIISQINSAINQDLKIVRSDVLYVKYLHLWFQSMLEKFKHMGSGTTVPGIKLNHLTEALVPIPPFEEQIRIVEHAKNLVSLAEEYGELEEARENLDVALPEQLRKSILQQAVQGKLVAQDSNDEPASILLERIHEQRHQLIADGKTKFPKNGESVIYTGSDGRHYEKRIDAKGKVLSNECIEDEIPFEIPENWAWARLEEIGDWKAGATPLKSNAEYYRNGNIPWLLTGDLNDGIVKNIPNFITETALKECSVRLNPVGSVLVAMYGATIGKIGVLAIPSTTNQACCACILHDETIRNWLVTWLLSYRPCFIKLGMGGAQPNISREKIISQMLPIPPIAEQQRIVERAKELLQLLTNQ